MKVTAVWKNGAFTGIKNFNLILCKNSYRIEFFLISFYNISEFSGFFNFFNFIILEAKGGDFRKYNWHEYQQKNGFFLR